MADVKRTVAAVAAVAMMAPAAVGLAGCDAVRGAVGQGSIGAAITSSRHVDPADKEKYTQLAGLDGNVYVSVLSLKAPGTTHIDVNLLKSKLTAAGVNWYQVIASSAMGTNTQEVCYVYLPSDATFDTLSQTQAAVAPDFEAVLLTTDEYKAYVDSYNPYNIYQNETTYFGPAAQG